ncbi:unnamed protein product, partial [marine sediment metagenome]
LLLMAPTAVSAASGVSVTDKTGDGEWIDDTWQVEMSPGEAKSTTLTLYNSSTSSLEVWVTISSGSLDGGNVIFELKGAHSIMPRKSYLEVTLSIEASGSATPGTYETELTIRFEVPPAGVRAPQVYSIETDLFGVEDSYKTSYKGEIQETIEATSEDGNLTITLLEGTTTLDTDSKRLKDLSAVISETIPTPPEDSSIVGLAYDFSPDGATFNPPITFTWIYNLDDLPENVADLVIAYYNEETSEWVELPCIVDPTICTITASVTHFTTFAIIGWVPPMPPLPPP